MYIVKGSYCSYNCSQSSDMVDIGAPCMTTDSSGSNSSDGVITPREAQQSPVHFLLPILTPKTPSSGDFTQLKNYTHNQIILNRVLSNEKHKVIHLTVTHLNTYTYRALKHPYIMYITTICFCVL